MAERYRTFVDVHLILRDGNQVLLGRRRNTGFGDGRWHPPAGHVEDGEAATSAMARETAEEIGVRVDPDELRLVHVMHHCSDRPRVALFFEATGWQGHPTNREPHKCAGWQWFDLSDLPTEMVDYAAQALGSYLKGVVYAERGWRRP